MKDNSSDTMKSSKISNFDRLVQDLNLQVMVGLISKENYENFLQLFKMKGSSDAITQINAMTEEQYNIFLRDMKNQLQNYGMNSEQQDGSKRSGR